MNTPSLRLRPLAAAILCSLIAPALFAQTATTTPVGFITVTVPGTPDPNTPANIPISIPLYATASFQGSVFTVDSATTFTLTGAAFTAGQFGPPSTTQAPYLVRIKVGTQVGKFWLITGNTNNQLTVQNPYGGTTNIVGVVGVGDSCEIVPANTLGSVFGTTSPVVGTGASASAITADNVLLFNGETWDTYYHNGTNWKQSPGLLNKNNTAIYPDEGAFIIRKGASFALTLMGTVPSTIEKTDLNGAVAPDPGYTFISNRFPVDSTLNTVALQTTPNWVSGLSANAADNVLIWNAGTQTWDTFYYNGTIWKQSPGIGDKGATSIPTGTGVFVIRTGVGTSSLTQNLPYTP